MATGKNRAEVLASFVMAVGKDRAEVLASFVMAVGKDRAEVLELRDGHGQGSRRGPRAS